MKTKNLGKSLDENKTTMFHTHEISSIAQQFTSDNTDSNSEWYSYPHHRKLPFFYNCI